MDLKELRASDSVENISHHPWEYARFNVLFSLMKKYSGKKKLNILDIGCGDTFFLEMLSSKLHNCNFYGVDIAFDDKLIAFYENKHQEENIKLTRDISELEKKNIKADIIFILDVIEHLENDFKFLLDIRNSTIFSENTIMYVTVPAFNFLYITRDKWLGHHRRYTLESLKEVINKSGYCIKSKGFFFTSLLIARFISVIAEKIIKPDINKIKGIGNWKKRRIIDFFIKSMLITDFRIFSIFKGISLNIPGLSCYAICKKQ